MSLLLLLVSPQLLMTSRVLMDFIFYWIAVLMVTPNNINERDKN